MSKEKSNRAKIIKIRSLRLELCVIASLHASNSKKNIACRVLRNAFVQCKQSSSRRVFTSLYHFI